MRIARFSYKGSEYYGVLENGSVQMIKSSPFDQLAIQKKKIPLAEVKLLAPTKPGKIIALGMNYRSHAEEIGLEVPPEPGFFFKPPSSVIGPHEAIHYPEQSKRVDYEAELAIIIKRTAKNVPISQATDYILGYTCFNDITARDIQFRTLLDFNKAKSFDTFAAIGPWIETDLDPSDVKVEAFVNGELKQSASTKDLIFSVPEVVSFISTIMTLFPGDVIATGTPSGIGPLKVGDEIEVRVEGIGSLRNVVVHDYKGEQIGRPCDEKGDQVEHR